MSAKRKLKVVSEETESDEQEHELVGTLASDLPKAKPSWLWPDALEWGTTAFIQGEKSAGKSTWLRLLAAAVTGGARLPGQKGKPKRHGGVLWFAGEEPLKSRVGPGLAAAGARMDQVETFDTHSDDARDRLALPADCARLQRRIEQRGIKLVVIDPVFNFSDGTCDLDGPTVPARRFMSELGRVAARTGALLILSRNLTKDTSRGAINAGRGGGELGNAARAVLHCHSLPDRPGEYGFAFAAVNNGRPRKTLLYRIAEKAGCSVIDVIGESALTADDLVAGEEGDLERYARDKAKLLIKAMIPDGKVDSKIVKAKAEAAMIGIRTLQAAAKALGVQNKREGSRENTVVYWLPPKGGW